jgi:hypothetical protein
MNEDTDTERTRQWLKPCPVCGVHMARPCGPIANGLYTCSQDCARTAAIIAALDRLTEALRPRYEFNTEALQPNITFSTPPRWDIETQ